MNCVQLLPHYDCRALRDGVFFIESPYTLGFDGEQLGAYVQTMPDGNALITDDGQILTAALSHGIKLRPKLLQRLTDSVRSMGIEMGSEGDFLAHCSASALRDRLPAFFEGCLSVGHALKDAYPVPPSGFEDRLGDVLERRYAKRVQRRFSVVGASGHQYQFPFALDAGSPGQRLIHTVSGNTHSLRWSAVTQALGALVDVSRLTPSASMFVVIEGGPQDTIDQAKAALVEQANVIVYHDERSLDALGT
ncbi:protein of unknown function DUF1828 [Modicisalibacter muralis]|uniref:Uncharacterized protein n=1 Tax=Modicisalibacter muralis TaxID=119000 RepID=A0A1G9MW85_9GAMM|nr:DUF1828 domain-containing protein [Halomonas muralis]SDL78556.1 protein of unknown function DUF1828 [Halomonas muralis]